MKSLYGWFLFGALAGYGIASQLLMHETVPTLGPAAVSPESEMKKITSPLLPGFLFNWEIPTVASDRKKALQLIGETMSIDVFLDEWETTRKRLSLEDQASILGKILPRILFCRPQIGINRICSLVGNIPPGLFSIPSFPQDPAWFTSIFKAGAAKNLKTEGEKYLSDSIFSAFADTSPQEASLWARQNWSDGGRETILQLITSSSVGSPSVELVSQFLNEDQEIRTSLANVFFSGIHSPTEIDHSFAIIGKITDPKAQVELAEKIGSAAGSRNLDYIWKGLQALPEGAVRDSGVAAYFKMLPINDPRRAMDLLQLGEQSENVKLNTAYQLIKNGYLSKETLQDFAKLAENSVESNPTFGAKMVESIIENSGSSSLALSLTEALPQGIAKNAAQDYLARNLPQKDPVTASSWINTLPPKSSVRDDAILHLVGAISDDIDTASAWASTITDETKRENAMRQISNPDAVR